jgi:hypothetical protein
MHNLCVIFSFLSFLFASSVVEDDGAVNMVFKKYRIFVMSFEVQVPFSPHSSKP